LASDFELERSPEARALAEEALLRLLATLGDQDVQLVVLGGLVPEVLTQGLDAPGHLGTTDVDIHISFHTDSGQDLGVLENALERAAFEPDPKIDGWRWRTQVSGVRIAMEFLCDQDDAPANATVSLPGCRVLTAANLRGTGFVGRDWAVEELTGTFAGQPISVKARFAGLQGYLMAKAYAVRFRSAEKDYYDFVYVLLFNRAGGAAEIGAVLRDGKFADDLRSSQSVFREIAARFANATSYGPSSYATQALRVNPEEDASRLRQDAARAVGDFIEALGIL
jgi:hypothetical protein